MNVRWLLLATLLTGCVTDSNPNVEIFVDRTVPPEMATTPLETRVELITEDGTSIESIASAASFAMLQTHLPDPEELRACIKVLRRDTNDDCTPAPFKYCPPPETVYVTLLSEVCEPVVLDGSGSFELTTRDAKTGLAVTLDLHPMPGL